MTMAMLTPHLPYSMALIYSHDADARGSESEDDIDDYLGGVGRRGRRHVKGVMGAVRRCRKWKSEL